MLVQVCLPGSTSPPCSTSISQPREATLADLVRQLLDESGSQIRRCFYGPARAASGASDDSASWAIQRCLRSPATTDWTTDAWNALSNGAREPYDPDAVRSLRMFRQAFFPSTRQSPVHSSWTTKRSALSTT